MKNCKQRIATTHVEPTPTKSVVLIPSVVDLSQRLTASKVNEDDNDEDDFFRTFQRMEEQ